MFQLKKRNGVLTAVIAAVAVVSSAAPHITVKLLIDSDEKVYVPARRSPPPPSPCPAVPPSRRTDPYRLICGFPEAHGAALVEPNSLWSL